VDDDDADDDDDDDDENNLVGDDDGDAMADRKSFKIRFPSSSLSIAVCARERKCVCVYVCV
jgi:hypothetical protein